MGNSSKKLDNDVVKSNGFSDETAPGLRFVSSLDGRKKSHKIIAYIMLVAMMVFVLSMFFQIF